MANYRREFLDLCLSLGVLKFGEFTLKSGRVSPYFFNAGLFQTGRALKRLGRYYARSIIESGVRFDMLYGPAYKGIPLAASIAIAFDDLFDRDVPYAYNRKEVKDHGEGGNIVGAPLEGRVLVVDDVISAGTSARESAAIIDSAGAELAGLSVALDRQEKGSSERSALAEIAADLGTEVISIVRLDDLVRHLGSSSDDAELRRKIEVYRNQYAASGSD